MLRSLLQRWQPRPRALPDAPVSPPVAVASTACNDAAPLAPAATGARRPLVSRRGDVAGFEFRLAEPMLRRLEASFDPVAAGAHTAALLAALRRNAASGRLGLAELPARWLERPRGDGEVTRGMLIALRFGADAEAAAAAPAAALAAWRAAGAHIGWSPADAPAAMSGASPDFVLLRADAGNAAALPAQAAAARQARPGVPLLALDLACVDDLEQALAAGVDHACGTAVARRGAHAEAPQTLPPQLQHLARLMHQLVQGAPTDGIVTALKSDAGLTWRLLRLVNAAGVSGGVQIASVEQAVLRIGRNELYRWLSVLLVALCEGRRPVSRALQEMALTRARLLELLAAERGEAAPGDFFTLGLASMLDLLLGAPLTAAMASLGLPAEASQALLEGRGPWRPCLDLALLVERNDRAAAEPMAEPFGGIERVLALAEDAWAWTAEHGRAAVEAPPRGQADSGAR